MFRHGNKALIALSVVFILGALLLPTFWPAALIYLAVTSPEDRLGAIIVVAIGTPIALGGSFFIVLCVRTWNEMENQADEIRKRGV